MVHASMTVWVLGHRVKKNAPVCTGAAALKKVKHMTLSWVHIADTAVHAT